MRGYQKYSELFFALLVAERNNELLIKNYQSRPARAKIFPEANVIITKNPGWENNNNYGNGCRYRRGRGGFHNPQNNTINKKHRKEHHSKEKKILAKILLGILKILTIDAALKYIGHGSVKHPSTFVNYIRHLSKENRRKLILSNLLTIRHILIFFISLMISMRRLWVTTKI